MGGPAWAQAEPPFPPQRPFDMDLPKVRPLLVAPGGPEGVPMLAPLPPVKPESLGGTGVASAEPPAQEVPDVPEPQVPKPEAPAATSPFWPPMTPAQQEKAENEIVEDTPTGPGITTDPGTSIACLPARLRTVIEKVAQQYGSVRVTSTYRPAHRARRGSYHRRCEAVDFRVFGRRPGEVMGFVRTLAETGGRKVYWNGLIHVDTGPDRPW